MVTNKTRKFCGEAIQLLGCVFVVLGIFVWIWWLPYFRTQGVVRMEKTLSEEAVVAYIHIRSDESIAFSPENLSARYRDGDLISVLARGKAMYVSRPWSIWQSPFISFGIGAAFSS
jgi:hypothetical protein